MDTFLAFVLIFVLSGAIFSLFLYVPKKIMQFIDKRHEEKERIKQKKKEAALVKKLATPEGKIDQAFSIISQAKLLIQNPFYDHDLIGVLLSKKESLAQAAEYCDSLTLASNPQLNLDHEYCTTINLSTLVSIKFNEKVFSFALGKDNGEYLRGDTKTLRLRRFFLFIDGVLRFSYYYVPVEECWSRASIGYPLNSYAISFNNIGASGNKYRFLLYFSNGDWLMDSAPLTDTLLRGYKKHVEVQRDKKIRSEKRKERLEKNKLRKKVDRNVNLD